MYNGGIGAPVCLFAGNHDIYHNVANKVSSIWNGLHLKRRADKLDVPLCVDK